MSFLYSTKRKIVKGLNKLKIPIIKILAPIYWKEINELNYWRHRQKKEGVLSNNHYEYFYTKHFGKEVSYYKNKIILDIGCGPRGSLEWAFNARRRIGLDPLANDYFKLGANKHKMEYVNSYSEKIPLQNEMCDAVFSFNSLDHVENIEKSIGEIKRVVRSKGIFLLIVEVNHPPRDCEPHSLTAKGLIDIMKPEFVCEDFKVFAPIHRNDVYSSIYENTLISDQLNSKEEAFFSAEFVKK